MCFMKENSSDLIVRRVLCVLSESGHVALLGFVKSLNVPINMFNCLNIRNRIRIFIRFVRLSSIS